MAGNRFATTWYGSRQGSEYTRSEIGGSSSANPKPPRVPQLAAIDLVSNLSGLEMVMLDENPPTYFLRDPINVLVCPVSKIPRALENYFPSMIDEIVGDIPGFVSVPYAQNKYGPFAWVSAYGFSAEGHTPQLVYNYIEGPNGGLYVARPEQVVNITASPIWLLYLLAQANKDPLKFFLTIESDYSNLCDPNVLKALASSSEFFTKYDPLAHLLVMALYFNMPPSDVFSEERPKKYDNLFLSWKSRMSKLLQGYNIQEIYNSLYILSPRIPHTRATNACDSYRERILDEILMRKGLITRIPGGRLFAWAKMATAPVTIFGPLVNQSKRDKHMRFYEKAISDIETQVGEPVIGIGQATIATIDPRYAVMVPIFAKNQTLVLTNKATQLIDGINPNSWNLLSGYNHI